MKKKLLLKNSIFSIILASMVIFFAIGLSLLSTEKNNSTSGDIEWTEDFSQTPTNSDTWLDNTEYHITALSELEGSGTQADPYKIYTAKELAGISYYIQSTNYTSSYFVLCNDIDLSEHYWVPIGGYYKYGTTTSLRRGFNGEFDGQGHTISGVYTQKLSDSNAYSYMGLFGYISNDSARIMNLNITDSYIQGYGVVGGVVGYFDNGGHVINCSFDGVISGNATVGGIVGAIGGAYGNPGIILECKNYGKIFAKNNVGGILGRCYPTDHGSIVRCENFGEVSASNTSNAYAGGIEGYSYGRSKIQECSNYANVTAQGNYVGGILGGIYSTSSYTAWIDNCFNSGNISGVNYVAGISGQSYDRIYIDHCYNSGAITGTNFVAGLGSSVTNSINTGSVSGSLYVYALTFSTTYSSNSYYGGNCGQIGAWNGADNEAKKLLYSETLLQDMTDLLWYQNSDQWSESWDFNVVWNIVDGDLRIKQKLYWDDVADTDFLGQGTAESPYEISTPEELAGLSVLVSNGNVFSGSYFELTQSIDMQGRFFSPIGKQVVVSGTPTYYFKGNFNGNSFTISNLTIFGPLSSTFRYYGLFSYLASGSTIENLLIEDINLVGGGYTGGIAGYNTGAYIENCSVTGEITGAFHVGGIAGLSSSLRISNCTNYASIKSNGDNAGGICGEGSIDNCKNYGSVSRYSIDSSRYYGGITGEGYVTNSSNYGEISGKTYAGGIAGGYNNGKYSDNHNYGDVSGSGYVGGIVGRAAGGSVGNCSNHGEINATATSSYCGGIVGNGSSTLTINNCYNEGSVTGQGYGIGGIAGANAIVKNSYNTANITATSSQAYAGGIVGQLAYSIDSCYNTGTISSRSGQYVGGLVGSFATSGALYIENSYNIGQVSSSGNYVGGLAGNSTISTISTSYNLGSVSGGSNYVGGIAGYSTTGSIINCFNGGSVQNTSGNMGAVLGYGNVANINNVYFGINCSNIVICGSGNANVSSTAFRETLEGDVKNREFFENESLFDNSSPWDFMLIWQIDETINDGYPSLKEQSYWQDQILDTEFEGEGSNEKPYKISSEEELAGLAKLVNSGNTFSGKYFQLEKNLDLSSHYWEAIGNSTYSFSGTFDGNNYTISGVYIAQTTSYQGLFGYAQNGELKNIKVENSSIQGGSYVGGVVGRASSNITNCYFEGDVNGSSYAGGIFGYKTGNNTTENCITYGNVSVVGQYVGGIGGYSSENIINSKNYAVVQAGSGYVGGILGYMLNSKTISNCENYGNVSGGASGYSNLYIGGIVGLGSGDIVDCVNYGKIFSANVNNNLGQVSGIISGGGATVKNCVNYGDVEEPFGASSGISYAAEIENCTNYGNVNGGGITYMSDSITNCVNYGNVKDGIIVSINSPSTKIENCVNYGNAEDAGVIGYLYSSSTSTRINILNCANFGTVSSSQYAGGIIGRLSNLSGGYINIDCCFNAGDVYGQQHAGGFIGKVEGTAGTGSINFTNCGSEGNVSGEGLVGAFIGNGRSDLNISNCYAVSTLSQEKLAGDDISTINNCVYILTVDDGAGVTTTYKKYLGDDFTGFAWFNDSSCPIPKDLAWSGQFQEKPSDYQDQEDWIKYKMQQEGWTAVA